MRTENNTSSKNRMESNPCKTAVTQSDNIGGVLHDHYGISLKTEKPDMPAQSFHGHCPDYTERLYKCNTG